LRRSVQSQAKNLVFPLDESLSPFAVQITLSFISIRVINNARNEVWNEESCGAINPCCSGVACCWSDSRGAAAEESPSNGVSVKFRFSCGKRLELLKDAVPKLARVAVLYDPATVGTAREVKEDLPVVARALELTVRPWEVRTADGFERVFAALNKERPDGLYVTSSPLFVTNRKRIVGFALKSRLPSVYSNRETVNAGGLMYYGADLADSYRRIAYYVDRILKGAKPADLPVEQPTKFELVINLKTAKQIGLTIPPEVLARANSLIK
jgi:ABC-type uncharacterized transport system substrate-binding protein